MRKRALSAGTTFSQMAMEEEMSKTRMRKPAVALCAALFLFAGCARFSSDPSGPRGQKISSKQIVIFPLFVADREVYENGIQEDGNFLLFISWSKWTERPYSAARVCECEAAPTALH
jgi:hypothetical protein